MSDINAFRSLEREAGGSIQLQSVEDGDNPILLYWDALHLVVSDEIQYLKSGGEQGSHAKMMSEIHKIFEGQSLPALVKMKKEVDANIKKHTNLGGASRAEEQQQPFDRTYWQAVSDQLAVHLAKAELSHLHSKMLVRQLEKLEKRKDELASEQQQQRQQQKEQSEGEQASLQRADGRDPQDLPTGDLEDELGLNDEIDMEGKNYSWQDRYRPRKPRYFNRVKTGYDWNKYNQTHYDRDNPPPKTVQGYRFSIFYNDLIDPSKTPQYVLEPTDSDGFCIIRFRASAPYEDLAFKIINREWDKSRKRGFKSTFERGVLTLNFNFKTHWYRR